MTPWVLDFGQQEVEAGVHSFSTLFAYPQHLQAKESTPAFDDILRSLEERGLVKPSMLCDVLNPSLAVSTLNLASFTARKEEAFQNVLLASRLLGLDTEEYPVEHFLNPLMS